MDKIIKRLIFFANQINNEYDILMELSFDNLEHSKVFNDHCCLLEKYYYKEKAHYDALSPSEIDNLIRYFENSNLPKDDNYYRITDLLDERFRKFKSTNEFCEEEHEELLEEDEDISDAELLYEDYDSTLETAGDLALTRVYIKIIKRAMDLINSTPTENDAELKYAKNLRKYFRMNKYALLVQNEILEEIAIKCRFDIDKLPDIPRVKENVNPIYFNKCIEFIEKLCEINMENNDYEDVCLALFTILCIEELLIPLDIERLEKIKEYCLKYKDSFYKKSYANEALKRIKQREKKI